MTIEQFVTRVLDNLPLEESVSEERQLEANALMAVLADHANFQDFFLAYGSNLKKRIVDGSIKSLDDALFRLATAVAAAMLDTMYRLETAKEMEAALGMAPEGEPQGG